MIESNLVNVYGMYSPEGDEAVHDIVVRALEQKLDWKETYAELRKLADINYDRYGEAMDTMVREIVYDAIGADKRGECFYI
jgi:hypothetical protein